MCIYVTTVVVLAVFGQVIFRKLLMASTDATLVIVDFVCYCVRCMLCISRVVEVSPRFVLLLQLFLW